MLVHQRVPSKWMVQYHALKGHDSSAEWNHAARVSKKIASSTRCRQLPSGKR